MSRGMETGACLRRGIRNTVCSYAPMLWNLRSLAHTALKETEKKSGNANRSISMDGLRRVAYCNRD